MFSVAQLSSFEDVSRENYWPEPLSNWAALPEPLSYLVVASKTEAKNQMPPKTAIGCQNSGLHRSTNS